MVRGPGLATVLRLSEQVESKATSTVMIRIDDGGNQDPKP